ncbi:MAG TPA: flippase activity-associated protein Agl23 [Anaerolineales bacterium]|nr:flippase activity-associated protein Agl23 [Anaerolineales bacterium]
MEQKRNWLDRPVHPALPAITNEILIFSLIILAAIVSRFYNLGARVMSHDESLHTYFSWLLYRGQGYQHTPMMHGPWQFHLIALSYFLFGASDFTARIPAALFSIMTIAMVWYWKRYIGKTGALIAGFLMVISPYLLFYGRYVREDMYAVFSGVLMLYVVLRYLETGQNKYLYLTAVALVIHFLDKETSYIYTAQLLIFLTIYFIARVTHRSWEGRERDYRAFIILLAVGILVAGATVGVALYQRQSAAALSATETLAPANPNSSSPLAPTAAGSFSPLPIIALVALLVLGAAVYFLFRGYGWERIRSERSFDLLTLTGMLVLPLLTAFLIKFTEPWLKVAIPTDAASVQALTTHDVFMIAIFIVIMYGGSAIVGYFWKRDLWWKLALTFWVPFIVLYTTFFTNSDGFFTGVVGSLGYWLVQQGVQRGSQPLYYYILIQIPVYEFLPAIGLILALIVGLRRRPMKKQVEVSEEETDVSTERSTESEKLQEPQDPNFINMFSLLAYWSIISVVSFSFAGERMPWLTTHLTWPMILITGWALGRVIDTTNWEILRERRVWLVLLTVVVFLASLANAVLSWGLNPPFQGKELAQLEATNAFILPAIVAIASGIALTYLLRDWTSHDVKRVFTMTFFALLAVLTARTAFRAAYINYDDATEYMVYAHGATGIKQIMAQAQEISERTAGGLNIPIAYDASAPDTGVSWPFVWYLRDYTNQRSFDAPTRSLRDSVIVIVDQKNFDKIDAALGSDYYRFDYIRMWWPNQDYFNLISSRDPGTPFDSDYSCTGLLGFFRLFKSYDFSRICTAVGDPNVRAGIIDIWFNRDYTRYAQAIEPYAKKYNSSFDPSTYTLANWQPSDQMRMYIRKDVAAQIWNYGVGPAAAAPQQEDPTVAKTITLAADLVIDSTQPQQLTMNAPRSLAFAPDGTFYVADSLNHRILHFDATGKLLGQWGSFFDGSKATAPLGTFNEPWGIAVGNDGSVYVADTWNHRIEKFTADGKPIKAWGLFGQADTPDAFYGPRGIAVDNRGRVYVTDTGNKRVVIFDTDGNFITQFGMQGLDPGQFDEPVGIAVDNNGRVYVADTWNQRIQTFIPSQDGLSYTPDQQWQVYGWNGQGVDNKPYIAVDGQGNVFITDPEGYRVMEFSGKGDLLRVWGDYGNTDTTFGLPSGIAVDAEGRVWVTDAGNQRILRFTVPQN